MTFTGYNFTTATALTASSFVTVSASTGDIAITASAPIGTYKIQIVGLIASSGQKQGVTVTLTGYKNTPPYLDPSFSLEYSVNFNSVLIVDLPVKDDEGQTVTTTLEPASSFVSVNSNRITIHPTEPGYIGKNNAFHLKLSDSLLSKSYTMKISVLNTAPIFYPVGVKDQVVVANTTLNYSLPRYFDRERQIVKVENLILPSFVTFIQEEEEDNLLIISPSLGTAAGPYRVSGALSDGVLQTPFKFNVNVMTSNSDN